MKKMNFYAFIGILVCLSTACSDFLEEYSPDKSYVRSYSDLEELLVGEGYMQNIAPNPWDYSSSPGSFYWPYIHVMADETEIETSILFTSYKYGPRYLSGYYTWQEDVTRDYDGIVVWSDTQDWEELYRMIGITNMVIALIDDQLAPTDEDKQNVQRIKGEAYFLRGAYYFTLVNLWGQPYAPATASTDLGVPVKLSEAIEDKIYVRESVEKVYQQVLSDLLKAESCLKDIPRKSVVRVNHTAVCLLLSRVYLYMQNYEEALKWAKICVEAQSALINLNEFDKYTEDFLNLKSPELIFTMGSFCIADNVYGQKGDWTISKDLYNTYVESDLRKSIFFRYQYGGSFYGMTVGKVYNASIYAEVSDNFLLRSAESYLNLAEAAACLGGEHTAEALDAYNTLRRNRFETGYTDVTGLTGKELVDSIRVERRRELCFEGHRWFDLRRYMVNELYPYEKTLTNKVAIFEFSYETYMNELVDLKTYELPPHDPAWTLPIPRSELDANYGMQDNTRGPREPIESLTPEN